MKKTVGIDLGTTRSAISHVVNEDPEIIKIDGDAVVPSVIHIDEQGNSIVGTEADNQLMMHPDRTVEEIKREMGENVSISLGSETYTPEEISSIILRHIVNRAEQRLEREIGDAVITVPAYFGDRERKATITAAELADLNVDRLLPEPSAACLAYALKAGKLGTEGKERIFVYDLGGGTFDAALVEIDYSLNMVETIRTEGDVALGGSDWTNRIVDWVCDQIETDTGVQLEAHPDQLARVREEARQAKHRLSEMEATDIGIPFVVPDQNYNFESQLTLETFNSLTRDFLEATMEPIERLFYRSEYSPGDIDKILLVGGATRMTQVEQFLTEHFGQAPSKQVNPDEAVALGAAIQAELLNDTQDSPQLLPGDASSDDSLIMVDVVPKTLGVELENGEIAPIIETDTSIPVTERKEHFRVVDEKQTTVYLEIYEGEGSHASDENTENIGTAVLEGIPSRDPHKDTLAVEFEVTADGTLRAQGEDLISGKAVETTIESVINRSENEIEGMKNRLPPMR